MTQWLFDTLVMTSALMLLVLILREPVRARFGAGAAYALWAIPAARMLMPTLTQTVEREVPMALPEPEPVAISHQGLEPIPAALPISAMPAEPASYSLFAEIGGWAGLALYIWAAGAVLMLFNGAVQYRRQRAGVLDAGVQVAKLDSIRIVRSESVRGPLAFGFIDRVIAFPVDFDCRFDARQRRLALDHELAHHRSGDLYFNLFAYVLLCLQWFNPLAWMSHAAFRFDQEAACDARVLDKAVADDRAAYGHAIAKAASGRALLFASALDRPSTLQRRLKTMLNSQSRGKRATGKLLVIGTLLVTLPLTATKAIDYVDVPVAPKAPAAPHAAHAAVAPAAPHAPHAPHAPSAVLAPAAPNAPLAPAIAGAAVAPTPPVPPTPVIGRVPRVPSVAPVAAAGQSSGARKYWIDGQHKEWKDLTPEEKAEVRQSLREAREEIREARRDSAKAMAEARASMKAPKIDREKIRREMAEGRAEIERALAEVERDAAKLRANGKDPETVKMALRTAQASLAAVDVEKIVADAMKSVDMESIERTVAQSLAQAEREIERAEREIEAEERRN